MLRKVMRFALLIVMGFLSIGCASTTAQSPTSKLQAPTAQPAQDEPVATRRKVDPDEHYRRVMERAARRGTRVIWVHPPKHATAEETVSPPQAD